MAGKRGCLRYKTKKNLGFFENKVLRRHEKTVEWRKIHNVELHQLYNSPDVYNVIINVIESRQLKWAGHVARIEEDRTAYGILVGEPIGKRPLSRPRHRWEDNVKMDLDEMGCES